VSASRQLDGEAVPSLASGLAGFVQNVAAQPISFPRVEVGARRPATNCGMQTGPRLKNLVTNGLRIIRTFTRPLPADVPKEHSIPVGQGEWHIANCLERRRGDVPRTRATKGQRRTELRFGLREPQTAFGGTEAVESGTDGAINVLVDTFDKNMRSWIMSRVKSKGTRPEIAVKLALKFAGCPFSFQPRDLPGNPDFVFPRFKLTVFVNGCFWHWHGCPRCRMPTSNKSYWQKKIASNVRHDKSHRRALTASGWHYLTIWECNLKSGISRLLRKVRASGTGPSYEQKPISRPK
jgi:DNA mismatch endonuclease (patch repair protein)